MALSPKTSRGLALALFAVAVWLLVQTTIWIAGFRYGLHAEINELRHQHADLQDRRVDIKGLEQDLAALVASRTVTRLAIAAEGERGAASRLQEIARKSVADASGKLVALNANSSPGPGIVATQLRGILPEKSLLDWLISLETGDPRVEVADLLLTSRNLPGQSATEVDVTAVLRARWRRQEAGTP